MKTMHTTKDQNDVSLLEDPPLEKELIPPGMLLLSMFDIEELAALTDGERRLLAAVAEANISTKHEKIKDREDYAPFIRERAMQPKPPMSLAQNKDDDPLFRTRKRRHRSEQTPTHKIALSDTISSAKGDCL